MDTWLLHQTGGSKVMQINGVVEIHVRMILLPWQRNFGNFKTKLAISQVLSQYKS